MQAVVLSFVASVVALVVIFVLARSRFGMRGVCWFTGVATVVFLFSPLPYVYLPLLGSFLVALACAAFHWSAKTLVWTSAATMLVFWGLIPVPRFDAVSELRQLRAAYPLKSVAERLRYEEQRAEPDSPQPALGSAVEERLSEFENRRENTGIRSSRLAWLHDKTREEFVKAEGFGSVRLRRLPIPASPPVPLPMPTKLEPDHPSAESELDTFSLPQNVEQSRPSETALLSMHDNGLEDFLNAESMGYAQDRDHVAGFEPHRFLYMPGLRDRNSIGNRWRVVRIELISLLKHETPVAYVSPNLPQMDQLSTAPTRPLNSFERHALGRLRSDEDLVVDEQLNRIRMVGSLRAAKSCLDCHSVRRGDLLGAFTYEIVPLEPALPTVGEGPGVRGTRSVPASAPSPDSLREPPSPIKGEGLKNFSQKQVQEESGSDDS